MLERCTIELGFHGAMINGYTNLGDAATGLYYDDPRFWSFWEGAEALGAPIYLHPRDPLPANQGIYEGHPELFGAVWTFTVETATHALRLMTSGLFDRFPNLTVIIGHLGETLPFAMCRIDHRVAFIRFGRAAHQLDSAYLGGLRPRRAAWTPRRESGTARPAVPPGRRRWTGWRPDRTIRRRGGQ